MNKHIRPRLPATRATRSNGALSDSRESRRGDTQGVEGLRPADLGFDTLGTPSVVGRVLTISELAMRASFITNV